MLDRPDFEWNDERVQLLKLLWADGYTGGQCVKELTPTDALGPTRNAVIGKVHRLGIAGPVKVREPKKPRVRKPRTNNHRAVRILEQAQFEPEPFTDLPPDESPCAVTFERLDEAEHCRWPIGTPGADDFRYCGDQRSVGSYCRRHDRAAHSTYTRPANNTPRFNPIGSNKERVL